MKHLDLIIIGDVHGVSFRYYSKLKADELSLVGFVQNQKDGTVRIEIEGNEKALEVFCEWCKIGPEYARIKEVKITDGQTKNYNKFSIMH